MAKTKTAHPLGFVKSFFDIDVHGVTYSVLTKWKGCRERARLHLQGWTSKRSGSGTLFGTFAHAVLEQVYREVQTKRLTAPPDAKYVRTLLAGLHRLWRDENPKADARTLEQVELILLLLESILPIYFETWRKDFMLDWRDLEHQFVLPTSWSEVPVRGKIDGSFTPPALSKQTWLFETKTKSRLGEQGENNLVELLGFELQVNLYLSVLWLETKLVPKGLLYNVIRRPNLEPRKNEPLPAFRARLIKDIRKRPQHYFIRLRMSVDRVELEQQQAEIREMIADFVQWARGNGRHYKNSDHCENKYGTCEFLSVCSRQDYTYLYKRPTVYRELEEV